ncbi:hypothetical protein ACF1AJ_17705 [Leifsonia sp. NPDC014704]|uniref:hypothetical protein n=1 Tax=Leifsonia sp. NPDC014704 TaxID=3364123 RepID=UPI0036F49196
MNDAFPPYTNADLLAAAARVHLPPRPQEPSRISSGQLWRLEWDGVSTLGTIAEDDDRQPLVVPVSFESDSLASGRSISVPGASAHATAFTHHAKAVPAIVLDSLIADLATPLEAERVDEVVADPYGALDVFERVHAWTALADGAGDLGNMLKARLSPSDLKRILAVDGTSAMALLRNERPLTTDEAAALADVTEIPADVLLTHAAPIPSELKDALFLRQFRGAVRQYAKALGGTDSNAWVVSAQGIQATRYRQTGPGDNWVTRAERFFEGEL